MGTDQTEHGIIIDGLRVVDSIEQSTIASSWTEYLCLHRSPGTHWILDIRGFEVVGETHEYEDEDGELPETIDGWDVVGSEDGLVIVNNLVLHSDAYPAYEFDKFNAEKFEELFGVENSEWCTEETKTKIREAILSYAG